MTERVWVRRGAPLVVLALCALGAWARFHVNAPRDGVAHGDTGYYLTLAQNLANGRGFFVDYVPDFLAGEKRIPNPANTYWQPLTSVFLALPMMLFGATFATAQAAMALLSALAPAVAYLLGREMFGGRRHGLVAAVLATTNEGYLSAACQPQTHALVLVIGGLWLWLALRARRDERWLIPLGLATALLQLNRGDGFLYLPLLALLWLWPEPGRPRWSLRGLVQLGAAYALAMAPLWAHNLASFGAPMPPGLGRVAFLVDYDELYALPESLTLERYLDRGWDAIAATKTKALATNGMSLLLGVATGTERAQRRMLEPHHWALLGLVWLGWPLLLRRRYLPVWGLVAVQFTFFTAVFSTTGVASFRATMFPVYLAYFAAAGRVLDLAVAWIAARAPAGRPAGVATCALLLAWIGWSQVAYAAERTRLGVRFIAQVEARHAAWMEQVIEPLGLQDAVIMADDVHELHVHTGLKLVTIPHEPEPVIHRVAKDLGVTHVLVTGVVEKLRGVHPGLPAIPRTPEHFELVFRELIAGEPVRVYRVL
jgi:4-amino-4-deoxy-L-arabinose transferase-like glycosyltransferase